MSLLVNDPGIEERLKAERQESGADRFDEVWDGVYVMAPLADDEHLELQGKINTVLQVVVGLGSAVKVRPGANISDRDQGWTHNYRVPDVVVFFPDTRARSRGTHWVNGPDIAFEITSPFDQTRNKLAFYSKTGVRELFILDRDPWLLELYCPQDRQLALTASTKPSDPPITSQLLPISLQLIPGTHRPSLVITHRDTGQTWIV